MPQGLIWDVIKYFDQRRKEDYNKKIQVLKFATDLAQKTGNWEQVQKIIDTNFPEWGIEITQPTVEVEPGKPAVTEPLPQEEAIAKMFGRRVSPIAGVTQPTGMEMEGITGERVVAPGMPPKTVPVTQEFKRGLQHLQALKARGYPITPEMATELLTGIKTPTEPKQLAVDRKLEIGLQALKLPEGPEKQMRMAIIGNKAPQITTMWGQIIKNNPNITNAEMIKLRKQMLRGASGSSRSMTTLESYVRSIPELRGPKGEPKSPWELTAEEMNLVIRKMVRDKKWSLLGAFLFGEEMGKTARGPETNVRLKELIRFGETRDLTKEEQAELDALWAETRGTK